MDSDVIDYLADLFTDAKDDVGRLSREEARALIAEILEELEKDRAGN